MTTEAQLSRPESPQIFDPIPKSASQPFMRPATSQNQRQGIGIKGLISSMQNRSRTNTRQNKKPMQNIITSEVADGYLLDFSKQLAYTTLNLQGTSDSKRASELSLRDKRLIDIQKYRLIKNKDSSRGESPNKLNLTDSPNKRPTTSDARSTSVTGMQRRRNIGHSSVIPQPNQNAAFSFESIPKEQESPGLSSIDQSSPLFYKTSSNFQIPKGYGAESGDTGRFSRKASDPSIPELKPISESKVISVVPLAGNGRLQSKRSASTTVFARRRRGQGGMSQVVGDKPSSAMSIELFAKGNFFGHESMQESPTMEDQSAKLVSIKEDSKFQDNLTRYQKKANAAMPKLKIKTQFKQSSKAVGDGDGDGVDSERKKAHAKMLQTMNPLYSNFITEKFNEEMMDRMGTFYSFGFTKEEKNGNQEINTFFNEVNQGKNTASTMGLVDLWSIKMRAEVAGKAKFSKEKHMLEKFSFHTSKNRKVPGIIQPRASDSMDKHKLAMRELTLSAAKFQDLSLVSPMIRHKLMRGKTFCDPKEATVEAKEAFINSNNLNQEMGMLLENLNQFEEQNHQDYQKVLRFQNDMKSKVKLKGYNGAKEIQKIKSLLPGATQEIK